MTSPKRLLLCSLALLALVCTRLALAEELVIPGSGNPEHVLGVLANAFNQQQTQHRVSVPGSTGTAGALRDVQAGSAVLGRVGRPLTAEELALGLKYIALGRDPVTFVAGAAVTVRNLTFEQVMAAYSGKVGNWKDLGGQPGPIRAIGRESTDASRSAINKAFKAFQQIPFGNGVKIVNLDPQMVELLDRYPTSLGFLNRSALAACNTKVVMLALDGVESTPANVGAGRYPLWLEMGLIHKPGKLTPAALAFLAFAQSSEGVRILRAQGMLAAPGQS